MFSRSPEDLFGHSRTHGWRRAAIQALPTEPVGRFDSSVCDELVTLLDQDDGRLRREIGFLVDRRNRIAHGLSEGVTQSKAIQLRDVSYELADWFILRFNPER